MYPTGDVAQTDTAHCTIDIPCIRDGLSNDFILAAVREQLSVLTDPGYWDDRGYAITAAAAAAYAQAAYDTFTVT